MLVRINNIKIPITENQDFKKYLKENYSIHPDSVSSIKVSKKSVDARSKNKMIYFVYSVDAEIENNINIPENQNIQEITNNKYISPETGEMPLKKPPLIAGSGPAGLFCALNLARRGFKPIIAEMGSEISKRKKDVENFRSNGILNPKSNIQFGEGGAGTFSDGKLNTLISDKNNRIEKIYQDFHIFGAPENILYYNKPHIGTDILEIVVKNIRNEVINLGGTFLFDSEITDIEISDSAVKSITLNAGEKIYTDILILATGHSSRNMYFLLKNKGVKLEQKAFSVGLRIEHPQLIINQSQYGKFFSHPALGAADYKLSCRTPDKRAVYTFCMCPGGEVIASASESETVVTNGMSKYLRNLENANSALLVNIDPADFRSDDPVAGIYFQKDIEKKAFMLGGNNYHAPAQYCGSFLGENKKSYFSVKPTYRPGTKISNLKNIFPEYVYESLQYGIKDFGKKIKYFDDNSAFLTAPETRSSSPVRILRTENFESVNTKGLFPAGEGAGYSGGITSSAVDGLKIAEKITETFYPDY